MLLIGCFQVGMADILHIKPYAQWTFDEPLERVVYRKSSSGFPIKYTISSELISYFDSLGQNVRQIPRSPGDKFQINPEHSYFMLSQENESILAEPAQLLHSFKVFDGKGNPEYTMVYSNRLVGQAINATLTGEGSILLTQEGQGWILEMHDEDTLLHVENALPLNQRQCVVRMEVDQLVNRNEFITASSCISQGEDHHRTNIELNLWNHHTLLSDPVSFPGTLGGLEAVKGTDYFFLEMLDATESTLALYNRNEFIASYPWKTWDIRPLGIKSAFVISEADLHVVNLGDGSLISSFHPIDIAHLSDAAYLPNWGLYLYLRFEAFFTEEGQQAYRKFELEGVSKTGRIAHRSSFGNWTTSLPKISQIEKDLFAIHMHNAVLLYRVELEKE